MGLGGVLVNLRDIHASIGSYHGDSTKYIISPYNVFKYTTQGKIMLKLNILNRHGIEFTYSIFLNDYNDFNCKTKDDYMKWVDSKLWSECDKFTAESRVGFALDLHYPNHFYEFEII